MLCFCMVFMSVINASATDYVDANVAIGTETYPDAEAILMLDGSVLDHGTFASMWNKAVKKDGSVVRLNKSILATEDGFGTGDGFFGGGLLVPENKHVSLDLNGNILNRNLVDGGSNKRIITLFSDSAMLSIYDGINDSAGGIITGCDTDGSAIYCNGTINFYGGSIRENTVGQATVWVGETGYFNVVPSAGHAEIVSNVGKAGALSAGIYNEGMVTVKGDISVEGNVDSMGVPSNIRIGCDADNRTGSMMMVGPLGDDSYVHVTSDAGSSVVVESSADYEVQQGDESHFASDDSVHVFDVRNGYMIWHESGADVESSLVVDAGTDDEWSITGSFAGMWNLAASLGKGEVTLLKNVTARFPDDTAVCSTFGEGIGFDGNGRLVVENDSAVVLNLNGYTLDKNMSDKEFGDVAGEIFIIKSGSMLSIKDDTDNGAITGAFGRDAGAFYVCDGGVLDFAGGILSGNRSMEGYGGIYNNGDVYISGGHITENSGGIYLADGSTAHVSDCARVYDNMRDDMSDNMRIGIGAKVYVKPGLDSSANVYFNFEDEAETRVAQKESDSDGKLTGEDANAFIMDSEKYHVEVNGDDLVLGAVIKNVEASYSDPDGKLVKTGTFDDCWSSAAEQGGTVRLIDNVDLSVASSLLVDDVEVSLVLNGFMMNITRSGTTTTSVFKVQNGGSMTVRGKDDPHDDRVVVATVAKSATNLRETFLDWNEYKATQPFGTTKYVHYLIESNGNNYELVKYTHDFADVGKLVIADNSQGFLVDDNSELTIRGGLLLGSSQLINVTNSSVLTVAGGFIYGHKNTPVIIQGGSRIEMSDGEFIANTSTVNGGAVRILDSTSSGRFTGGTIASNTATRYGGAISSAGDVVLGSNLKMSMNHASYGGAVAMVGSGTLTAKNRKFLGPQASDGGGAIWSSGHVDLTECEFVGCGLTDAGSQGGGAIYMRDTSGNSLVDCVFNQCEGSSGGAIAVTNKAVAVIDGAKISRCVAAGNGGAIYSGSGASDIRDVSINDCVSGQNGGGIAIYNGSAQISGSISGCSAAVGGGIIIDATASNVAVDETYVIGNTANLGAGIYVGNNMDNDIISESVIEGNVSSTDAGGIGAYGTNRLRILSTQILGNHANESDGYGAAIMLTKGSFVVQGCEIASNTGFAGTVNIGPKVDAVIAESDIHDNTVQLSGGGIRLTNSSLDVTNTKIRSNIIAGTSSEINENFGGAGIISMNDSVLNVTNCSITNNSASVDKTSGDGNLGGNGGGILQQWSVVRVTDSSISRNVAKNGGGIYCTTLGKEVLSIIDSQIDRNEAYDRAGGINTREDMTLTIGGKVRAMYNQSDFGESDVYLRTGVVMQIIKTLDKQSDIGVSTDRSPTVFNPVPFASGIDLENALKYFYHDNIEWEKRYDESLGYDLFVNDSAMGELSEDDNTDYDGILVQYYAVQNLPARVASNATSFELIDTSGGVLPTNQDTHRKTISAYIDNATGQVVMQEQLSRIFKARVFDYDRYLQAEVLNRFMKEDGWMWSANEIWILKPGKLQNSLTKSDWDIVQWEPGKTLGELGIKDGDCIRIVSESVESSIDVDTTFYDYDITDGVWYSTKSDADNYRNAKTVSSWSRTTTSYQNTGAWGINSNANYGFDTRAEGTRLTFGNVNTGVAHRGDKFEGYYMNGANLASNNYRQCVFGLVKGLDDAGNIIYADGISVPNLFDDGDAIGKTVIGESTLHFKRVGDTYTLTAVNHGGDTVLSDLDTFEHPVYDGKTYTSIYTNNFWPMDELGVADTDGHDFKTGSVEMTKGKYGYFSGGLTGDNYVDSKGNGKASSGTWAPSDDGIDHNNFFGMHFAVKFSTEEDYVASLGYYFFGDDDMWVFLDGELICDIGGVHSSAGSYTDLRDYIEEGDTGEHMLSFYYTERGASGSTCWMQFNLPHNVTALTDDSFMFLKTNQNGKPLGNAVFGLYRDQACQDLLQTVVSDETGSVNVTDLETTCVYYLKEMSAPEDYVVDENTYVVTFGEGAWSMYDISDGTKNKLSSLVNEYDPKVLPEMPETGGIGTKWIYVGGGALLLSGLCTWLIIDSRRRRRNYVRF
ncbi:MAG: fibro-slime domain-containing protein [Clostridia bacterium]|nr:fibro-slime domain-containing protein [Clostridia bacterium]